MKELDLVRRFYGDRKAERSGVPLINHIHEGLDILSAIKANEASARAFCLHPIFQADADLAVNAGMVLTECLDPWVMTLVMEYRNQANAWLSDKVVNHSTYSWSGPEPRLVVEDYRLVGRPTPGPLPEIREMLTADKVQNYKDFRTYHQATHPRSKELEVYFETWLRELRVTPEQFEALCVVIDARRAADAA